MRIISGFYKGKVLDYAKNNTSLRPTTDRVKTVIFDIIRSRYNMYLQDKLIIDLFAGSGSLGLECLSRGASKVIFCEKNSESLCCLKTNISFLKPLDKVKTQIIKDDAVNVIKNVGMYNP